MTISTAIAALAPSIWYKLDGSTATEVNNGTQNNSATLSGTYTQQVPGPEIGTFATRLYLTGQVVSHQMDLTTYVQQTIGMWVSCDASGLTGTTYYIAGIGDPGNRGARGPLLSEIHSAIGAPQFNMRYGTFVGANAATQQPVRFWHWIVGSWGSGAGSMKLYVDGALVGSGTITGPQNPLAIDPLLVRCDEPIIVAHVCWWGTALNQTQVQSVSNELATWPYGLPVNLPPESTGGGGGGLTEDQAAQLSAIDTKTDDIPGLVAASTYIAGMVNVINGKVDVIDAKVNDLLSNWAGYTGVTLPDLQAILAQLQAAVTTTLEQAGEIVQRTVGQVLSNPPWASIGIDDLSGGVQCAHWSLDISRNNIKSIFLQITDYPDDWKWRTPDRAWSLRDLAVIHFIHGGVLIARYGVHTAQYTVSPVPGSYGYSGTEGLFEIQGPDLQISVDFAEGVCGRVYSSIQI